MTAPTSKLVRTAAVIGAGPAGASAAIHLARLGLQITLIESKKFPRSKVCGEYISPAGNAALERVLTNAELLRAGATRVDRYVLQAGARTRAWRTPHPAWGLSRRTLDTLLAAKAKALGIRFLQPVSVRRVEYTAEEVCLTLASGETVTADLVIHADGSGRHDPGGPTPHARRLIGHKCHARLPEPVPGVAMRAGPGAYVGSITVEGGLSTIALVSDRAQIAEHGGDADAMLRALWSDFDPAWRSGPWLACGVPRSGFIEPGHPRSVRLGNAAGAVDPVGGEGIGLALWSAMTFADLLGAHAPHGSVTSDSLHHARQELARAYRRRLRWRLPACRAGAELLMRPMLVRATWPMLCIPAITFDPWYRLTGKPWRDGNHTPETPACSSQ